MKKLFAYGLAPLVFLVLSACYDFSGIVGLEIDCPLPVPVISADTTLTGSYNGLCEHYIDYGDSVVLIRPTVQGA